MKKITLFFAIVGILGFAACGEGPQNSSQREALNLQNSFVEQHDSVYAKIERLEAQIESEIEAIDDETKISAYKSMLRSFDKAKQSLDKWQGSVYKIEGAKDFKYGNGKPKSAKGISDEDNLKIQQEMSARFNDIKEQVDELFATIETYNLSH